MSQSQHNFKIRPSEDIVFPSEVVDPQQVTVDNLELYLQVRPYLLTRNFSYLYQPSGIQEQFPSHFVFWSELPAAQAELITNWSVYCTQSETCSARIYRYQCSHTLNLVDLTQMTNSTDYQVDQSVLLANLQNYQVDGFYQLNHRLSLSPQTLKYAGVSYLLVSPNLVHTLNPLTGDINQVISTSFQVPNLSVGQDYLFNSSFLPASQNYSQDEFLRWLRVDASKILAIYQRRR